MNPIAHIEVNVRNLKNSSEFYSNFLKPLNWEPFDVGHPMVSGYKAPDGTHLFLVQTEEEFLNKHYHRKQIGLNHLAFRVDSPEKVDSFTTSLIELGIPLLYGANPKDYSSEYGKEKYYAVFVEDPDRIKLEVVYYK